MKLLNVGCGSNRPQDEHWWNLDCLRETLNEGTPERANLDAEPRYVEHLLGAGDMPFNDEAFHGVLISHVLEHFTCNDAVEILKNCRRLLKPGGLLVVSVPDADYFLSVHDRDTPENGIELFGEPIHDKWQPTFMSYALFHANHRQALTKGSLWCHFLQAGFTDIRFPIVKHMEEIPPAFHEIQKIMNRRRFSLELCAVK